MSRNEDSKKEKEKIFHNQIWEYKILHLRVNSDKDENKSSSPEIDSKKLKGVFSPSFIKDQFPEQYKNNEKPKPKHPADQMSDILNNLGKHGWELVESTVVGELQFFIFKREKRNSD